MVLSLKEHNAISGLADALYDFLPGSGNQLWRGHITFASVAAKVGVGQHWRGGSKKPAIVALLSLTLERDRNRFEPLILEIVKEGLLYRKKNGSPLTAEEIDVVNGHILDVGFKFPALWDPAFKASLRVDSVERAKQRVDEVLQQERVKETARDQDHVRLEGLTQKFFELHAMADRSKAGLALEELLTAIFELFELNPRKRFRVTGEEIDGSFELDHETYLLQAKWEKEPVGEAALAYFRSQIEGKSSITRGVFISINGVSQPAKDAISRGKQPFFFAVGLPPENSPEMR